MPSAERTITIRRPAAEVFAYVADGTNGPTWRSSVLDVKLASGHGTGAVYRQSVRGPLRRRITADYEITQYDQNKRIEFKAIAGPVRPTGGYRFQGSDGSTKLTFWLKGELTGWKRLVLGRSVQRTMDAEMKALEKLKELLEGGGQSGASKSGGQSGAGESGSQSAASTLGGAKPRAQSAASKPASKPATPRTARRRNKAS